MQKYKNRSTAVPFAIVFVGAIALVGTIVIAGSTAAGAQAESASDWWNESGIERTAIPGETVTIERTIGSASTFRADLIDEISAENVEIDRTRTIDDAIYTGEADEITVVSPSASYYSNETGYVNSLATVQTAFGHYQNGVIDELTLVQELFLAYLEERPVEE
ncbi:hypothetical protein BRC61_02395 [Halobacteriales archaeon QH_10_65_19]|nr:MAG: hypothetical protein BRC61_02395 [Halobacteriales archaeon QH_10_65_19]